MITIIAYIGKRAREEKGISIKELADKSTVTLSEIHKYETGQNLPDLAQLDLLAIALGVGLDDLIQINKVNI